MNIVSGIVLTILRIVIPFVCVWLTLSLYRTVFKRKRLPVIATLAMQNNPAQYDIISCENFIGRGKLCDIRLNFTSVSRRHALLSYDDKDGFKITALSNSEIFINGILVEEWGYIDHGDVITIGGINLVFVVTDVNDLLEDTKTTIARGTLKQTVLLTVFQALSFIEILVTQAPDIHFAVPIAFVLLIICEWVCFIAKGFKGNLQIEIIGFLLTGIGISICATAAPDELLKLTFCVGVGIIGYLVSGLILTRPSIIPGLQIIAMVFAGVLLLYNIIMGEYINGARNWIMIGSFSFQPSEIIKFVLIFVGGTTLVQMMNKKNFLIFIGFACFCIGALFLMRDFGTASIYFITMLIIIYMRQGSVIPILATVGVAIVGIIVIISVMPYVLNRFSAYRHVWELASSSGYQQTRTLIAIASGGLFGVGADEGNLQYVAAADTDLVFGIVCEEWGMIVAFCAISLFLLLAIYTFKRAGKTTSAFYAITACAAAGMFLFQISLNIFGSTDILPLTGVTIPFISNGGSSMIASWLILSFIKACGKQFVPYVEEAKR